MACSSARLSASRAVRAVHAVLVRAIACVLAVVALLPGAASAQTKVVIGTAKDPNLGAQLVIARDKGFFRDAGLDVDLKYFPSGGDLMQAFAGGSVQIGSSGATPVTTLRARPYPVKIVAQIADIAGAQQLIVKTGVKTVDELSGKKIALLRGTDSEALLNSISKHYGLDLSKNELITMGPTEMLQAFVRGQVDAVSLWEPHTTRARKSGNGKILVSGTQSYVAGKEGPSRIFGSHSVLFTTDKFVQGNAKTVEAVLTALVRATEFMQSSRAEATTLLAKEFALEPADMTDVMAVNRYTLLIDDGLVADLDGVADFLHGLKRIDARVNARDWIDPAPLRAVRKDLVQIK